VFIKENDDLYSPPKSRLGAFADRLPIRRRKPPPARPPRKNPIPDPRDPKRSAFHEPDAASE
jgi:hypothetical protein